MSDLAASSGANMTEVRAELGADPAGSDLALVRLLQLASPTLPIGAYSYSQGLESVVADGIVHDAATAEAWVGDLLDLVVAKCDAPAVWRLLQACALERWAELVEWNAWFRCSRETSELRAETEQMGAALIRLASDLGLLDVGGSEAARAAAPVTLPAAFALAARGLGIGGGNAITAYLWSWLEGQVMTAMKVVPLGQVAGQRLQLRLGARIPRIVASAKVIADDEMITFAPGLALASARHETLYTRLFRS